MPKIKTHKAAVKRFIKTRKNKLLRRKSGQDHFNARATGKNLRNKRRDISTDKTDIDNLKKLIPYN